jgi:hypothetical protein
MNMQAGMASVRPSRGKARCCFRPCNALLAASWHDTLVVVKAQDHTLHSFR